MPTNHLIIGLGGTGGKILRAFRKTIYQTFRNVEPAGLNVQYLYVDSSDELMSHNDPSWKILGQSVQLNKTSQLKISGMNLAQALDSLASLPGIRPWLGSRDLFRNILNAADAANIVGGQKRRLGRFLFACRAAEYVSQVKSLVTDMQKGGITDTVFHVCCGLAGGTGGGAVIDAVSQIRSVYPDSNYRIIIYALLPDKHPDQHRAGANYHANGYAALMELNALSVGALKPHDITGVKTDRLTLQDAFNCCYLFTDENEDHNRVDIDKELPEIVSSFLYQKIVAARDMKWESIGRQETYEVGSQAKYPETSPSSGKAERSRLFFAFGIKQIAYPEEEIREYLTYAFARQAALQLHFNHWSDASGYLDDPVNQAFNQFVTQKDTQQNWYITDEHLCLSIGILDYEIKNKQWKPISTFWADLLPNFQTHVRETYPKNDKVWISELSKLCDTAYSQNYRNVGVRRFYETAAADTKDHVREIRRRIETELFQDWKTGAKSMQDISRLLSALLTNLKSRGDQMADRVVKLRETEGDCDVKVGANLKEWAKVGIVSGWLGRRENLFNAQAQCLQDLYVCRTRIEGFLFAAKLLQNLQSELTDLANEAGKCASMVTDATRDFADSMEERCNDGGQTDIQRQVVRFYQPQVVKDFARALVQDKDEQQKQTERVRGALAAMLGESQLFSAFNARIPKSIFIEVLEKTCAENAVIAHNNYVSANKSRSRILQVSVVERLYREYSGNLEALRNYVMAIVSKARNYLALSTLEQQLVSPGVPPPSESCVSYFTVIVPEAPELAEFRKVLVDEFANAKVGSKEFVSTTRTNHEITLVNITNVFPVRFVADVAFLKERYEQRVSADDSGQARIELHIEGDGSQLPPLYIRRATPDEVFPFLLIAKAMNLVQPLEDPDTGITSMYLITRNEKGKENPPVLLGRTLANAVEEAGGTQLDTLQTTVQDLLMGEFLHKTKREELLTRIDADLETIRTERKNPLDKTYKAYNQASQRAETILTSRS